MVTSAIFKIYKSKNAWKFCVKYEFSCKIWMKYGQFECTQFFKIEFKFYCQYKNNSLWKSLKKFERQLKNGNTKTLPEINKKSRNIKCNVTYSKSRPKTEKLEIFQL